MVFQIGNNQISWVGFTVCTASHILCPQTLWDSDSSVGSQSVSTARRNQGLSQAGSVALQRWTFLIGRAAFSFSHHFEQSVAANQSSLSCFSWPTWSYRRKRTTDGLTIFTRHRPNLSNLRGSSDISGSTDNMLKEPSSSLESSSCDLKFQVLKVETNSCL